MSKPPRPDWDRWALGVAEAVARRADCSRRQVGAVILDADRRIVGTGYNGAPAGALGCLSGACPRAASAVEPGSSYDTGPGACVSIHAEANALLYSDRTARFGGTLYVTSAPCDGCWRLVRGSGLARAVWPADGGGLVREWL